MKSKNIPDDIRAKSVKEAQNEIREIIAKLEESGTKLEDNIEQYDRMMQLNYYIQDQFKKKAKEIRQSVLASDKKFSSKNLK